MKTYLVSDKDIAAINRLIEAGGEMASIARDETEHTPFECGILSTEGYMPIAYGGGKTIADAIDEALNVPPRKQEISVSSNQIKRAMDWLHQKGVQSVAR